MKKSLTLIIILTVVLASCQKFDAVVDQNINAESSIIKETSENSITDMSALNISDSFDWKLIKTLDVEITLPVDGDRQITRIQSLDRNITYFNGYPEDESNLLKTRITIPTHVSHVLVEYGNGTDGVVVSVEGKTTNLYATLSNNFKSSNFSSLKATEPTFSCDVTVTQNVSILDINAGQVYCIENGTTITVGKIRFKGGTLHVKGKLIVTDKITNQGNNTGYLYVSATGEIDAQTILMEKISIFNNFGLVTIDNGTSTVPSGTVYENYGTVNCDKIVNRSETFLNEGILNVEGQFNNNGIGVNKGTINVTGPNGHFNNTGNPDIKFTNYCKIYVEQNFNESSNFYHYGYLEVDKSTNITGSSNDRVMLMGQYSLIVTKDLDIQGNVEGPAESGAKFKVSEVTKISAAADITGYIQICDATVSQQDNINNNADLGPNVDFGCDLNIPANDCNPGDNPPDDPPTQEEFSGTLAFEDLWPGRGDYDINDLVIEYDFEITKDNQEKVEEMTASFTIRAFGATLHNGFGFILPNVAPADIVSVTGYDIASGTTYTLSTNGTEAGQSSATFIVFDDPYRLMAYPGNGIGVNTDKNGSYVSPVTIELEIEFVSGAVSYSQLDIGNFNPFIVKDQDRGIEIHLPNYAHSNLADESYFGTFHDDTNPPSKYYLTETNLPWAIHIPAQFDYPVEKQIILGAYLHFADWAQGDGIDFADWYKDLPGYRNASGIY